MFISTRQAPVSASFRAFPKTIGKSRRRARGGGVPAATTRSPRRIISRVIWVQSASEHRLAAMRPPKIYLVVMSYFVENAARLLHSSSWFYPRKISGMSLSGAVLAASLALVICSSVISAAPFTATDDCQIDGDVMTLCQRCAKTTKSNLVYPMCCQNLEEAREWCDRYLNFGIQ